MMSNNTTVKEGECDNRRKDLYDKIQHIKEEMDKMKGGIAVFKYVIPGLIVALGLYVEIRVASKFDDRHIIKTEVRPSVEVPTSTECKLGIECGSVDFEEVEP